VNKANVFTETPKQTFKSFITVFLGFATSFVVNILENPELQKEDLALMLHRIFMIFPTYAMGKGITQIAVNHQLNKACSTIALEFFCAGFPENPCCTKSKFGLDICNKCIFHKRYILNGFIIISSQIGKDDYLDWDEVGIAKNLTYLFVFGVVFWILLLLTESGVIQSLVGRFRQKIEQSGRSIENNNSGEDPDVHQERERIRNGNLDVLCSTDNLVIR
jgi:hypothetical protein